MNVRIIHANSLIPDNPRISCRAVRELSGTRPCLSCDNGGPSRIALRIRLSLAAVLVLGEALTGLHPRLPAAGGVDGLLVEFAGVYPVCPQQHMQFS